MPTASRLFPALSCTNFRVLGLLLSSLIHFELILVQGDRHGSSFSFLQANNYFFPPIVVEEAVYSPSHIFGTSVKNKMCIAVAV
jgi:hypothetical protein